MTSPEGWQPSSLVTRAVLWPPAVFRAVEGVARAHRTTFTGLASQAVDRAPEDGLGSDVEGWAAEVLPGAHDLAAAEPGLDEQRQMRTLYWEDRLDRKLDALSGKLASDVILLGCVCMKYPELRTSLPKAHVAHA
ncbi:hypothetical protein [Streptomyces sp. TRM49041]|uniref:hypothetical protein n=1 Tax=Streptomyces sp. TRM49041 TaxID=2603216 RepID=UPI0011ECE709|nr:hypothetical protein [Streptomyces sp. TRM49041]